MATVSSISGSQAAQDVWKQLQLLQARRNADQAELTAQSLQAQAQDAQRTAEQADAQALSLAVQSDQAQENAGSARRGLAAMQSASQILPQITHIAENLAIQTQPSVQATAAPPAKPAPVVNSQGQITGTVVNTKA